MTIPTWKELRAELIIEQCRSLKLARKVVQLQRQLKTRHQPVKPYDSILEQFEKECE